MEAGLDSLGAVELRNQVASRYETELPATLIFDHPTAAALSGFVHSQMAGHQAATMEGFTSDPAPLDVGWLAEEISGLVKDVVGAAVASEQVPETCFSLQQPSILAEA